MKPVYQITWLVSLCLLTLPANSQDLSEHQWKNRILLVLTEDTLAPDYTQQMDSVLSDPEGLEERKLIIYKVIPSWYQKGITNSKWVHSRELYKKFHQSGNTLEVFLIGLDGSVKQRSQTPVPLTQIFSWIDSMPMRMQELRELNYPEN
jgi:hypothetical protein